VLYERLLTEYRAGEVRVQRLLIPLLVELTPADKELLLEQKEGFAEAGLLFEDFGGNTIKLEGYPAALRRIEPKALVEGFLDELREGAKPSEPRGRAERFHHAGVSRGDHGGGSAQRRRDRGAARGGVQVGAPGQLSAWAADGAQLLARSA
jgi:hypothetical protein